MLLAANDNKGHKLQGCEREMRNARDDKRAPLRIKATPIETKDNSHGHRNSSLGVHMIKVTSQHINRVFGIFQQLAYWCFFALSICEVKFKDSKCLGCLHARLLIYMVARDPSAWERHTQRFGWLSLKRPSLLKSQHARIKPSQPFSQLTDPLQEALFPLELEQDHPFH